MIHGLDKHWVARAFPRVLAGELQVLPTGRVVGICHESTLVLVRKAGWKNPALSIRQCVGCQAVPVCIKVITLVVSGTKGQSTIQVMLCCSVVGTPVDQFICFAIASTVLKPGFIFDIRQQCTKRRSLQDHSALSSKNMLPEAFQPFADHEGAAQ